jgi:hypothetical protein
MKQNDVRFRVFVVLRVVCFLRGKTTARRGRLGDDHACCASVFYSYYRLYYSNIINRICRILVYLLGCRNFPWALCHLPGPGSVGLAGVPTGSQRGPPAV